MRKGNWSDVGSSDSQENGTGRARRLSKSPGESNPIQVTFSSAKNCETFSPHISPHHVDRFPLLLISAPSKRYAPIESPVVRLLRDRPATLQSLSSRMAAPHSAMTTTRKKVCFHHGTLSSLASRCGDMHISLGERLNSRQIRKNGAGMGYVVAHPREMMGRAIGRATTTHRAQRPIQGLHHTQS